MFKSIATAPLVRNLPSKRIMSFARFCIPLLIAVASAGCNKQDKSPEAGESPGAISAYVEPTDEELARMIPGPDDAEIYTNVIEVHMDASGVISDEGNEVTVADLVNRVTSQPTIQDVQLNIIAPSDTPIRVVTRVQREIAEAVPKLERISVIFQPNN